MIRAYQIEDKALYRDFENFIFENPEIVFDSENDKFQFEQIWYTLSTTVHFEGTFVKVCTDSIAFPMPKITNVQPNFAQADVDCKIDIFGSYFTENVQLSIDGQTIYKVDYVSDNQLIVKFKTGLTLGDFDIEIKDLGGTVKLQKGFSVQSTPWVDLRVGGDNLSTGNEPNNNIRFHEKMSLSRDAKGMYFSGRQPWEAGVKFELLKWSREENKTLEFIVEGIEDSLMIGIGSDQTDERDRRQYEQAELVAYTPTTNINGLYGNDGTPGKMVNQSLSAPLPKNGIYKIRFENDGKVGSYFRIFELQSNQKADWDDETKETFSVEIEKQMTANQQILMPFIIPPDDGETRFVALRTL